MGRSCGDSSLRTSLPADQLCQILAENELDVPGCQLYGKHVTRKRKCPNARLLIVDKGVQRDDWVHKGAAFRHMAKEPAAGVSGAAIGAHEWQMLRLLDDFRSIDGRLDRAVQAEGTTDAALLGLHREWEDLCSRAASMPALTDEERRAKAAMLLAVLEVVAPASEKREPHEMLAESLARDLLRRL